MATKKVTTKTTKNTTATATPKAARPTAATDRRPAQRIPSQQPRVSIDAVSDLQGECLDLFQEWLRTQAPKWVWDLYFVQDSLDVYEREANASGGLVSEEQNSGIEAFMLEARQLADKADSKWA